MKNLTKVLSAFFVAAALILVSCSQDSKLKSEVITPNNLAEIAQKIKDDKNMSNEDIDNFAAGLARLSASKDSINGKTVGQIIDNQKTFLRNITVNNLEATATRAQLGYTMGVNFTKKLMYSKDTVNADGVELLVKNNTDKPISNVRGQIRIVNQQNQLIKLRYVNWENLNLKPGEQVTRQEFWAHDDKNQFDAYMRANQDLTAVWIPESITFADGKKLAVPTPQQ